MSRRKPPPPPRLRGLPLHNELAWEPWGTRIAQVSRAWLERTDSPATRKTYGTSLRLFLAWTLEQGVTRVDRIDREHVDRWRVHLIEQRMLAPRSVALRIAAISSWCGALRDAGMIVGNPCEQVRRPPPMLHNSTPMPDTRNVVKVLDWIARNEAPGYTAAVHLAAVYALRIETVCAIRCRDVRLDSGRTVVVAVTLKGGHRASVRVTGPIAELLMTLAAERIGPLFVGASGKGVTPDSVRAMMRRASAACDVPPIRPHMLRVHAITTALDAGHMLHDVAAYAHHADPAETLRYDRNTERRATEIAATISENLATHRANMQYSAHTLSPQEALTP